MRISFNTRLKSPETLEGRNGYGYATKCMLESLDRLGYEVSYNDPTADVGLVFDQPPYAEFFENQYKILYHPWESTELQPGWVDIMNTVDEIWTPSPLIAEWYRADGVTVPVNVYEHGIEHEWAPVRREPTDKIKFLHVGAEATRKGGWDVLRLFRQAFAKRNDVELTLKIINSNWLGLERVGKTNIINRKMNFSELQELFYSHHSYVYPSYGEGFGLTPLQAMASGMPTICPGEWAPYQRFLDPRLTVSATLKTSPWQKIHPGKMLRPNFDEVVDMMRFTADNYDSVSDFAMDQTEKIHVEYDWDRITSEVFSALEERLKNRKSS